MLSIRGWRVYCPYNRPTADQDLDMPAKNPYKLVREREIACTDGDPRPMSGRDEACADYNNMALDEWRAALSADLDCA